MKMMLCGLATWFLILPVSPVGADLLLDHVEFVRKTGVAQEASLFFPGCDPGGTYTLTVTNGQDATHRATGGQVSVNRAELVTSADFTQTPAPAVITRTIGSVTEGNSLSLSVTAPQGSIIGWQVTTQVTCPDITIDDPVPGSVINGGRTTVSGRVRHRTPEVGIVVNGMLAQVNGNHWAANGVELAAGGNALKATASFEDGTSAEATTLIVCPDPDAPSITLDSVVGSGIVSPTPETRLKVQFDVANRTGKNLVNFRVDYEGDGIYDLEVPSLGSFEHIYPLEGLFPATVVARDEQGVEYRANYYVNVHPIPPLKSKWEKMKSALARRDIAGAASFYSDVEKAAEIFTLIDQAAQQDPGRASLPLVAAGMGDIQLIELQGDIAEFRMEREEAVGGIVTPIAYYVHFRRSSEGFWKLEEF